jgi:glycosyltransferase involved in cell wall biosynthesis
MLTSITVVIPTYNRASFLCDSIKGLISQTFCQWTAWIVDNASSDNTYEVVQDLCDKRFKYIRHPVNLGSFCNSLFSLKLIETDYFAYLADDDYYLPSFLQSRLEYMVRHPHALACFGDYSICDKSGAILKDSLGLNEVSCRQLSISESLNHLNPYTHTWHIGSAIYRSTPVLEWVHNTSIFAGKAVDTAFKLRIASHGGLAVVPGVDYVCRQHETQDSSIGGRKEIMIGHATAYLYNYLFWSSCAPQWNMRRQVSWALRYVASQLLDEHAYSNARRVLLFSLMVFPFQPLLIARYIKYLFH